MRSSHRTVWYLAIPLTSAVLVMTVTLLLSQRSTTAEPAYPAMNHTLLVQGKHWSLKTEEVENHVAAGLYLDSHDQATLEDYAQAVQRYKAAAFATHNTIPALVTFRHPIAPESFPKLMTAAGATVESFTIRTIEPDGRRGTMGGAPEPDGTILDVNHVAALSDLQAKNLGAPVQVAGVIDAEVIVDRAAFEQLSAQTNDVFLVDIMRAVAFDHLPAAMKDRVSMKSVYLKPIYWYLEDNQMTSGA